MAGIYKRSGGIWWARVQKGGREFRDSLKTTDRRVANRRFKLWEERLEAIAWGERPRIAFSEAVRQFIAEHFKTLKPKSAVRYGISLKWLADTFEGKYLDEINRRTMGEFETTRRSGGVSSSSIRRDLACLSSLLAFCEDKDWIEEGKNPVGGFIKRRAKRGLKEGKPRTRYFTEAEEDAILAEADPVLYAAMLVAVDTGLREQEQFSLTWPQVDLRAGTIATSKDTKNGRSRIVPLGERSARLLAQWKGTQVGPVAQLFVFHHKDGSRFKNLYRGFKAAAERAKVSDAQWHDLRRTAGCRWLQSHKKRMEEVSIMLGHSSIKVTEKSYAFLIGQNVAEATAAQNPARGRRIVQASSGEG